MGVSPNSQELHIIKVFDSASCGWVYSSTLADAVKKCVSAGASVINMSLGGGFSQVNQKAMQDALDAGVLPVAAAGNGNATTYFYPASYDSVVSVAAVDSTNMAADFSEKNDQVEIAAPGVGVESTYPRGMGALVSFAVDSTEYTAYAVDGTAKGSVTGTLVSCGLGRPLDKCENTPASGTFICLIKRGEITFIDKATRCDDQGGLATIIYNDVPGEEPAFTLGGSSSLLVVAVTESVGALLVAAIPNPAAVAVVGITATDYATLQGTSMASPHVAGVIALVWSYYPNCDVSQIRTAMQATALDLGDPGKDNFYGHGLIQAKKMYDYLLDLGCNGPSGPSSPPPPPPPPPPSECSVSGSACDFDAGIDTCCIFCKGNNLCK